MNFPCASAIREAFLVKAKAAVSEARSRVAPGTAAKPFEG
jgi:hypothetical protein